MQLLILKKLCIFGKTNQKKSQYKKNNSKKKCNYFNIIIIIIFCFVEPSACLEGDKTFDEQFTIYSLQSGSFKIK